MLQIVLSLVGSLGCFLILGIPLKEGFPLMEFILISFVFWFYIESTKVVTGAIKKFYKARKRRR